MTGAQLIAWLSEIFPDTTMILRADQTHEHIQQVKLLAPEKMKYEQARLLTLLRSINPITVVDHTCKAMAYFGGIPGAPPPEDDLFPKSAIAEETGAQFIAWLSEIFPDISSSNIPRAQDSSGAVENGEGRHETLKQEDKEASDDEYESASSTPWREDTSSDLDIFSLVIKLESSEDRCQSSCSGPGMATRWRAS